MSEERGRPILTAAERGGRGLKNKNLADVICERSLTCFC